LQVLKNRLFLTFFEFFRVFSNFFKISKNRGFSNFFVFFRLEESEQGVGSGNGVRDRPRFRERVILFFYEMMME
jgi:hypothetical protein